MEPGEIAAIIWGVGVKGIRTSPRTGWAGLGWLAGWLAGGDGETWRLTGERRAAVQGPILE